MLPGYDAREARRATAARTGLPDYRRDSKRLPGFVRRRIDEPAAAHAPGDVPLGVAHAVSRTPEGDERLTGEGGAELGTSQVYPTYTRPANVPAAVAIPPAATPYAEGPAARRYRELLAASTEDTNGRGRSALRMFAAPVEQSNSVGYVIGERLGRMASGALNPKLDEETLDRPAQLAQAKAAADAEAEAERAQRERDTASADIDLKKSGADWNRARPGIEDAKAKAAAQKQEQAAVLANLRMFKGMRLDPNNADHTKLLQRAAAAGVTVDPQAWNDASSNLVSVDLVDPDNPTQKRRAYYNKATGEVSDVGVSGYVAPVGADGLTEAQRRGDSDRDRAYAGLEHERAVSNDLRRQGLAIQGGHLALAGKRFDLSQAQFDNRLSETTRKEAKAANDLAAEAERWQEAANAIGSRTKYVDPETGEEKESRKALNKRDEYAARAESLRRRVLSNYGYLFSPDDSGAPKMSTEQLKALFPSVGGNWSGLATRLGVTLTDEGSMQGPVPSSTIPRRAAPSALPTYERPGAASKKYSEGEIRAWARANNRDENAAVESARKKGLIQ
jgi:hypothetical protein